MSDKQAAATSDEITQPGVQAEQTEPTAAGDPVAVLQKALVEAEHKAAENRDSYLRLAAEMENQRKRVQRDLENAHKFALERFLGELLPVKDSLEMGSAAAESAETAGHKEGMDLTLKLLGSVMERAGVTEIAPAKGDEFNPELHEAMAMQESAEAAPGTVLTTVQRGYQLNGRLLRAARVLVAKAPAPAA